MIELLPIFLIGIVSGIVIGLIPGLAIWTAVVVMLPFVNMLEYWEVVIIWLGTAIGSQYFGSVSTLLFKIPGENSSLIFLDDVKNIPLNTRLDLIKSTAFGSFVASVVGFTVLYLFYSNSFDFFSYLSSFTVKAVVYSALFLMLVFSTPYRWTTAILFVAGVVISDKSDFSLPVVLLDIQDITSDLTVFSLILGVIIIPEIFSKQTINADFGRYRNTKPKFIPGSFRTMLKGSLVGTLGGLFPGQSATFSSVVGYNLEKKNKEHKIVCSESADNSAIIVGLLPLLLIGIPISLDTILMTNILQEKLVTVPTDFVAPIVNNLNIFDLIIMFGLAFSLIFLVLSQKFLTLYYYVVRALYSRTRILFVLIASWIAYIDHSNNPIGPYYLLFVVIASIVGLWLHKKNINPTPLIIGFILGDQIYWTIKYFIQTI